MSKIQKKSLTKKIGVIVFLFTLIIWLVYGNTQLKVTNLVVKNSELPKSFEGYKIAHVSDLHSKNWEGKLLASIKEQEPDIIVITGDFIDARTSDLTTVLEFTNQALEVAPIYYVSGNHEARNERYKELELALIKLGVTVLNNEQVVLKTGQDELSLIGLQDPAFQVSQNWFSEDTSVVDSTLNEFTENLTPYTILLAHRPELFDLYVKHEMNLVFSGHAHGGQVRVPFLGGMIAPNQGLLPKYTSGVYQDKKTQMVVSRGLGHSVLPLRINNPLELVIVELRSK